MADAPDFLPTFGPRLEIPMNPHLHAGGPRVPIEYLLALKNARELAMSKGMKDVDDSDILTNLSDVSENQYRSIAEEFGEEGLFKLNLLAVSEKPADFKHFFHMITGDFALRAIRQGTKTVTLQLDNALLKSRPELNDYNHNVINTSLSRKLFNPGRKQGYLVYGIGGPRILVSLPFIGASKFTYDVYNNSVDVVTSLGVRGYHGSFLLLDSIEVLNRVYV